MTSHRILDAIGNTPLVELSRIVPRESARIVVKHEPSNPTGSMTCKGEQPNQEGRPQPFSYAFDRQEQVRQ